MHRILIVDDNDAVRESLGDALAAEGYHVDAVGSGSQAVLVARETNPAVILLDLRIPDLDGVTVAARLTENGCPARIIVLSADRSVAHDAKRINAAGFLSKPFDLGVLISMIEELMAPRPVAAA
jgi:DNA-binding response OmpR family regulator